MTKMYLRAPLFSGTLILFNVGSSECMWKVNDGGDEVDLWLFACVFMF